MIAFFTALDFKLPASDPAFGSVKANAPKYSPVASLETYFFFCSSVPKYKIGFIPTDVCTAKITPTVALTFEISSIARM